VRPAAKKSGAGLYAALLRGINVGGNNKLPMKGLAEIFSAAGCTDVATYIQSGNVVFRADAGLAERIPEIIPKAIFKAFKLTVPVIVRSADELRRAAKGNPFLKAGRPLEALYVGFLAHVPAAAAVAALDPKRSPPDEFRVMGNTLYLYFPDLAKTGPARTKLTNQYFDSKLATTSTLRNLKTLAKLIEMTQEA
jgi:uncharacterized protein (DUF1697 family)